MTDSTYDTTYVKREEFNDLAKDFLETPDISKKFGGKYTEERMMNNDLGLVVFIATPKDEDLDVRRQEVRIEPNPPDDKIKSALHSMPPAFGRQEKMSINGKTTQIFLAKNPTSFNQSLETITPSDSPLSGGEIKLLIVNDPRRI